MRARLVKAGDTNLITVQQILKKIAIKLLLVLKCSLEDFIEERQKCSKYQLLPTEKVCNIFDALDDLEKSLDQDTKFALRGTAGYVSQHHDENINDTMC